MVTLGLEVNVAILYTDCVITDPIYGIYALQLYSTYAL